MSEHWVIAYRAANSLEAHCLKGLLESDNIAVKLTGENLSSAAGELPANVVEVSLWVDEPDRVKAASILQRYEQSQNGQAWRCVQCHEVNDAQFEVCWQCGCDPLLLTKTE
ncbi:DUF2007 domain-containing protein [Photobacterium swingsii]|uniref:DUF2007 domain-containing protein n=1 Tax=Photobacterium swingsii TaxID=680026 RepID=A0A0J8V8G8_9GAMM|nr:DUF2007 domain-containing protein [Photobacterium swingsii]KMV28945.1 hypothetical protein AB733_20510 [Photobacterium swingsii]PSW23713.1 DUF2007 domain-containing protein [Photobacterium swingsii]